VVRYECLHWYRCLCPCLCVATRKKKYNAMRIAYWDWDKL
jgi:hypothetical protein